MDLFAEVEVWRDRVLEEVDAEVADEDEEERVRDVGALGEHPDERRREHEPGAGRDEVSERGEPLAVGGHHERGAREIGRRRDGGEGQICYHGHASIAWSSLRFSAASARSWSRNG